MGLKTGNKAGSITSLHPLIIRNLYGVRPQLTTIFATIVPSCPINIASQSIIFLSLSLFSSIIAIILCNSKQLLQFQLIRLLQASVQGIMKESKAAKSKKGQLVINLIETPAGYSVVEGGQQVNKVQNAPSIPVIAQSQAPAVVSPPVVMQAPLPVLKQPLKMTIKQNNLLFLKSPTIFCPSSFLESAQLTDEKINSESKSFATWFLPSTIAEIQKIQVLSWVHEWNNDKVLDENAQKVWLNKYKQHRNLVVQIYNDSYAASRAYLSASAIRKYISDDARWLMKIHIFLTSWGIINNGKINIQNDSFLPTNLFALRKNGEYDVVGLTSSFYSTKNHKRQSKTVEVQNFNVLKKVTKALRPYCDYCGIHCQIIWFQHTRIMDPKQISTIMKNVNTKNPPLSQKEYEIILCAKCYCNGNFPLLLTHHDFRKVSVNDKLEPGKKKKSGKSKRKEKKNKMKEKQMMDEEEEYKEYKEQAEDGEEEGRKVKDKQKEKEEDDHEIDEEKDSGEKDRKNSTIHMNGNKENKHAVVQNEVKNSTQQQKQVNVIQIIKQVVASAKNERSWTFQETKRLLELIQKYGQDWDMVYKNMVKSGYCYDCEPEDLITYFIRLPQMDVSALIEQNNNECFINENKNEYRSDFLEKRVQRNFDNSVKLSLMVQQTKRQPIPSNYQWKELMNKLVNLHITKINEKIKTLSDLNIKALKQQRKFEETTKEIAQL